MLTNKIKDFIYTNEPNLGIKKKWHIFGNTMKTTLIWNVASYEGIKTKKQIYIILDLASQKYCQKLTKQIRVRHLAAEKEIKYKFSEITYLDSLTT